MPQAAVVAGAVVVGAGISYLAAQEQAEAQQNIANARMSQAERERALAMQAAMPSAAELLAQQRQIDATQTAVARQEKLLSAVDPALIEAGGQALKLLRGQEASVIAPMRAERAAQRQQLVNRLREQMGPGAETGSAGIQALNQFDRETGLLLGNAQQNALTSLLGTVNQARPNPFQSAAAYSDQVRQYRDQSNSMVAAIRGTSLTPYAGSQFVGEAYRANANEKLGGALMQAGLGAGLSMMAGGQKADTGTAGLTAGETAQLQQNTRTLQDMNYAGAAFADPRTGF